MAFFTELEKAIQKFMWTQRPQTVKAVLSLKNTAGDILIPGLNLHYSCNDKDCVSHCCGTVNWYSHHGNHPGGLVKS